MHERDLFIAAIEIDDESARRAYLDSACAGDSALRVRVERLLNREAHAGDFLEQPAADLCADADEELHTEPSEPEPVGDDPPTILGKADDTGQTVIVNPANAAPSASNSNVASVSQNRVTELAATLGTLFGRYRVDRVLGSGGMGVVYLAEDLRLGRRVALKIPKFDVDADGRFHLVERFRREARTMASVLHRNLCPIFDVDEQDGTHYLTMAFIDGETLAQVIKRMAYLTPTPPAWVRGEVTASDRAHADGVTVKQSFTPPRIADLIRKLALALDEAHRAGIVHRDLKPANVMIDRSGEPILMDFGLAWMVHETDARVTQSGAIIGTPAYMSPEQAEGDPDKVGAASDIYSLGAILYELLAGHPIHSGSVTRVLFKLMHERPIPPSSVRDDVDPNLEAICWKAISRRPEDRFATAADFAAAIDTYLAQRPAGTFEPIAVGQTLDSSSSIFDRTDVLPPDTSAETIAYPAPSVRGLTPSGSPSSMAPRGKSRIVLASLFLIGMIGVVWAIVANRETPKPNEVALNPKEEARPAAKSPVVGTKQKTVADPEPSPNFAVELLTSSDWEWTKPENLGPAVNTAGPEASPHFSADGRRLWFQRGNDAKNDQAWIAERETPDKPWNPAQSIGSAIEFSGPMADLFISRDEQTWMFVTWGPQNYSQQVLESTRPSPMANWSKPKLVAAASSPALFPVLSDDGLTLYITNARDSDSLYALTRRTPTESWSEPQRLPIPPNIAHGGVRAVWNSVDGRVLVFHTVRGTSGSSTQYDLWLTTRSSTAEPWQEPISFGPTINSTANERGACLSDDGRELIFASDRPDGLGDTDLYVSRRVRKPEARTHQADAQVAAEKNFAIRVSPGMHVEMPSLKLDPAAPHTIEAWVNPQSRVQGNKHVFGWPSASSLFVYKDDLSWSFGLDRTNGFQFVHEPQPITPGRRVHVAIVRTGQDFRLFVDGQRVASDRESEALLKNQSKPFSLSVAGSAAFSGDFDEVRVSRVARYDENFTPKTRLEPDADTLALYHCDENGGDQLVDASGNQHHGKIIGKATWMGVGQAAANADAPKPAVAPFDAAKAKQHQGAWAKHLGTTVETTNSVGAKMVLIPPGEFLMGAPDSDTDAGSKEKPQHRVRLTKAFAISATEITNRQFRQFVEATKYVTQAESDSQGAFDLNPKVRRPSLTWNNPEFNKRGEDERPVRCVSWEDARQFCEWLTQMEGRVYRLPTEAEWEFACRAGTDTRYSFGNDLSETPSPPGTNAAPLLFVAQLPANPFGLFDMHGNVNEMCWDAGRTFTPEPVTDPLGSLLMNMPAVVKGGAVSSRPARLRSSNRYVTDARQFPERDFASILKGFRVVAEFGSPPLAKAPFDAKQARAHQEAWAKQLGTTVETANSVGAKMILIPPGEFLMGSSDEDVALALKIAEENKLDGVGVQRIQDNERPQHFVRITKPFRLGIHEVTIGQFRKFIEQSGYKTQAEEFGGHSDATKADEPRVTPESKKLNWRTTGKEVGENSPVTLVSWNDAVAFCNWLSEQEKREPSYARDGASWMLVAQPQGYRLPTEAEWEYACRAGTTTAYSFGDDWKQLDKFGWSKSNAGGRPRGVGLLLVNPFGLYDMHGSVWEWCNDWFDAKWYARSPTDDPRGPPKSSNRVFRGGGWNNAPGDGRSSYRDNHGIPANGQLNCGFRIVAVVECAQPINASAGPLLPPPLNPGLTIHDPQWKLIEVIRPQGKVFSTRFDRQSRLCFAMPERLDDKSPPPGLYRVQPDGTHQAIVQNTDWEFAFSPDEQRCFAHRGTMGIIAEVDLKTGMSIREVDMSPSDDGPTSPHFAPTWYRGSLVNSNEYLLADFGGTKRGPPSTGGIWKFGSGMAAPQRLLTMPDGPARVHALAFGRDELFVAKFSGASSSLTTFDGQRLVDRPTEPLPSIGNMVFDPGDGSLLVSEFNGHAILRIDLAQPDRPASVKPLVSGFRRLNFGVMSLTQDGRRLAVVDFDANTIYVLDRSARDVSAAPVKQVLAAPLPSVTSATGLKLGDLDGDGDLDLFVAMLKAPCVMLRNDGKGNFTDSGQQLGDNASFALALGDLDGDGDLDAFVCNSDDQEDAIWLNDGRGLFQRSPQSFPPSKSNDVALADVDGDKDLDVVVSNWKGSVEIWTNDGAGRFTSQQTIPRINNTGVALGDLDNDGDADLVMTSIGGDNRVWFNDSQGHFADSEQTIEVSESSSVALGDLDRDGDLDLFITAHQSSQVWFNDGHGRFQASEQRLGDGPCEAVELVDLDADHDLDAVTIGGGFEIAKPRTVWRNDGQGRFQKDAPSFKPGRSQSLAIGDLDGDGDADVIFGNLAEPAEVWLNQSNQSTIP